MSSRSPRSPSIKHSSRSLSSRSPTPSSSRSSSATPSKKRSASTKSHQLLYLYGGIAAFLLFALLTNLVLPVKINKLASQCKEYTSLPNDNITRTLNSLIKENISKIELMSLYIEKTNKSDIPDEEFDAAIRKLYYYEDDDTRLHNCYTPINPIGFVILAFLLFIFFTFSAVDQYRLLYKQTA